MGFVWPSGRNRRLIALFGGLAAAALLASAAPAGAAMDAAARAEIQHQRGAHALRAGNPEEAIQYLDKALALEPDRIESLALKARALLEAGRAAEAEAVTQKLRKLRPNDYDATFLLALTAYRQQDWISAQRYLEEARSANPSDPRVHLYLGRTYQELGRDTAAQGELEEAARLDPEFRAPASYRLAILHLQRNEPREARRLFQQVKQLEPGSELASSAELYLKLMAANQPRRISYWAKLGGAYDSNITLSGGGDLVESSDKDGVRGSLETGVNARLFSWKGLSFRTGVTNYVSRHNREHDFDIQQIRPWVLATWQPLEWLAFDTRLTHERIWRDYHAFKNAWYVSPAVRFIPRPGWVTRFFVDLEDRNYIRAFQSIRSRDRDGRVGIAGFDQYIPLPNPFADGVAYLRFGWRYRKENATGIHFDSESHKPVLTLSFALPWNLNLSVDGSYERRKFRKPSLFETVGEILARTGNAGGGFGALPPFAMQPVNCVFVAGGAGAPQIEQLSGCNSNDRLDQIAQARVRLRKNIGKSFSVETYYHWTNWSSNTQEFDFTRHIVGLAATFRR